jgi:hypothetical protein
MITASWSASGLILATIANVAVLQLVLWWTGLSLLAIGYFAAKPRAISFAR